MSIEEAADPDVEEVLRPAPVDDRSRPLIAGVGAVVALSVLLFLRFSSTLFSPSARIDEAPYLAAIEAAHRGESPYSVHGYLYPPSFAALGGAARQWFTSDTLLRLLRAADVVASATLVWLAFSLLPWRLGPRFAAAAACALLAPGVTLALRTGNVSPIAGALAVAGLLSWERRAIASGVLMGTSFALKPLGALAAPILAAHRPSRPGRAQWWAAGAAVVTSAVLTLPGITHLGEFFELGAALDSQDFRVSRTVSLHRLLLSLGLPVGRLAVAVMVALGALILARARRWTATELSCFAIAACALAIPALWPHTLLMTLPIQVLALHRALRREGWHALGAAARRARVYEVLLVVLGVSALQWSDGVGGLAPRPTPAMALALLPPVLAAPLLAYYVVRRRRRADGC